MRKVEILEGINRWSRGAEKDEQNRTLVLKLIPRWLLHSRSFSSYYNLMDSSNRGSHFIKY